MASRVDPCRGAEIPLQERVVVKGALRLVRKYGSHHARQPLQRRTDRATGIRLPRSHQGMDTAAVEIDIAHCGQDASFSSEANRRPKPSGSMIVKSRRP